MKKIFSSLFIIVIAASPLYAQNSLTLTTYYPAPFGAYERMRLVPRNTSITCNANMEGLMFYQDTDDQVRACEFINGSGVWRPVGNKLDSFLYFQEDSNALISFNYPPDSSYDRRIRITAGESDTGDNDQGASIDLHGNNYTGAAGNLDIVAGRTGEITLWTSPAGTPAAERMIITNNGDVGIGTTAPEANLHVGAGYFKLGNSQKVYKIDPSDDLIDSEYGDTNAEAIPTQKAVKTYVQNASRAGCYVSYGINPDLDLNPDGDICLYGFTNMGYIGNWGFCYGYDSITDDYAEYKKGRSNHFRPPGSGCNPDWNDDDEVRWGASGAYEPAYVCCDE
jgi:hypothetical protein